MRGLLLGGVGTSMININKMPKVLINFATTELWGFTTPDGTHYGLTAMILVYVGLALMVHLILRYTLMGRSIYAMGGDQVSAQRIGFNLRKTTFFVYGLAGALAGFAGLLHSSMIWLANPRDFGGLELGRHRRRGAGRSQHIRGQGVGSGHHARGLHPGHGQEQPDHHACGHHLAAGRGRHDHPGGDGGNGLQRQK